jgi:hypothetical protein
VEGVPCLELQLHILANGALVYTSQGAEGCIHWGSDSSVVTDPRGEQGRIPLRVGLLSTWGSVNGDLTFFPILKGGFFIGNSSRR